MTAFQFFHRTGFEPRLDDMDRVNCAEAGAIGHANCGLCWHGLPAFMCMQCKTTPWVEAHRRLEKRSAR